MEYVIAILCLLLLWVVAILWKKAMRKSFNFHLFVDIIVFSILFVFWLIGNRQLNSLIVYGVVLLLALFGVGIHFVSPKAKKAVNNCYFKNREKILFEEESDDDGRTDRVVFAYSLLKVFLILFYILTLFE